MRVTDSLAGPAAHDHQETNMETGYRILAGIDVHKKMLAVVVKSESGDQIGYEKRKFGTTQAELVHLTAWLQSRRCERSGDGIDGAVLAAGVARAGSAL